MKPRQTNLFQEKPRYVLDTNIVVSFMKQTEDEYYGSDVFKPQWEFLESLIAKCVVIAPRQVETELLEWCKTIPEMKDWLKHHKDMFVDVDDDAQLESAKKILKEYPVYGSNKNFLGDLSVMTLADSMGIAALTLEGESVGRSKRLPKIPNVSKEFNIDHASFSGFLRREQFGQQ
jgi:hypothetical protein